MLASIKPKYSELKLLKKSRKTFIRVHRIHPVLLVQQHFFDAAILVHLDAQLPAMVGQQAAKAEHFHGGVQRGENGQLEILEILAISNLIFKYLLINFCYFMNFKNDSKI